MHNTTAKERNERLEVNQIPQLSAGGVNASMFNADDDELFGTHLSIGADSFQNEISQLRPEKSPSIEPTLEFFPITNDFNQYPPFFVTFRFLSLYCIHFFFRLHFYFRARIKLVNILKKQHTVKQNKTIQFRAIARTKILSIILQKSWKMVRLII